MSKLPIGFQFSQSSLQDFIDCRRRFYLRFIQRISWPAVESEPVQESERAMQLGSAFHHMAHQRSIGVPADRLGMMIDDVDLAQWWENYLHFEGEFTAGKVLSSELNLSASLGEFRIVAKYDLIVIGEDGLLTIIDWKTSRKRPRRAWLEERMQTRIYPYLLTTAGAKLAGVEEIGPQMVEMVYWFTAFPEASERFDYSLHQLKEDHALLTGLIKNIERLDDGGFSLTEDERRCAYCVYRSLCDRGIDAGPFGETEDEWESESDPESLLDFEQIAEIEF